MMDCDTTGIEPDLALVKYKKLVGGGMIKIVNNTVPGALFKLGYSDSDVEAIVNYIDATGTIEGAPGIKPEHLPVFDCSFKPAKGTRSIQWLGHVKMMAATQPFLSGAISKTVNLPNDCTVQDVADAYTESWRLGLKAVAIYRDGSKGTQPLNVSAQTDAEKKGSSSPPPKNPPTLPSPRSRPPPPCCHPVAEAEGSAVLAPTEAPSPPHSPHEALTDLARQKAVLETQAPSSPPADQKLRNSTQAPPATTWNSRARPAPSATACPPSAPASPTSSASPATKATSPSGSTPTAARAKSSSAWPRKAPPSRA